MGVWRTGSGWQDTPLHYTPAAEILATGKSLGWNFKKYWRPDPVSESIQAWYRTDELTPDIDGSGDLIVLRDQSGNGYDATATTRPSVQLTGLNDRPIVVFDGGAARLQTVSIPRLHGVDATIFLLSRGTVAPDGAVIDQRTPGDNNQRTATIHHNWAGDFYGDVGDVTGGTNRLLASPSFCVLNAWELITIERWAGNGWVWHNGDLKIISTDLSTDVPTDSQPFKISLGWSGEIFEILICTFSNETAKRQKIEGYMMHKAALAGLLPGTHPWKSVAP